MASPGLRHLLSRILWLAVEKEASERPDDCGLTVIKAFEETALLAAEAVALEGLWRKALLKIVAPVGTRMRDWLEQESSGRQTNAASEKATITVKSRQ